MFSSVLKSGGGGGGGGNGCWSSQAKNGTSIIRQEQAEEDSAYVIRGNLLNPNASAL